VRREAKIAVSKLIHLTYMTHMTPYDLYDRI
jgi:hypothetical protein